MNTENRVENSNTETFKTEVTITVSAQGFGVISKTNLRANPVAVAAEILVAVERLTND